MITEAYKQLLMQKHDAKPWGGGGASWVPYLLPSINCLPVGDITVLDYGCGRGTLKPELEKLYPNLRVLEYDPGVRGKDTLPPAPVSFVVCTDVMEHVEEQFVPDTLRTINWYAIHGAFFNIDFGESKSLLPDGRNTHITRHDEKWWWGQLKTHMPQMDWRSIKSKKGNMVVVGRRVRGGEE